VLLALVLTGRSQAVVLVGDSILESASDETAALLAAGGAYLPTIEAVSGSGLTTCNGAYGDGVRWIDRIRALDAEKRPDVLFVELGTGDYLCPDPYEWDGLVDQVLAATGARKVVWMLPAAGPWKPDFRPRLERIRGVLQTAETASAGRLRLVDMNLVAERDGSLEQDAVHYTPLGQQRLANLIRAGLD
jgi:hypothetical protein